MRKEPARIVAVTKEKKGLFNDGSESQCPLYPSSMTIRALSLNSGMPPLLEVIGDIPTDKPQAERDGHHAKNFRGKCHIISVLLGEYGLICKYTMRTRPTNDTVMRCEKPLTRRVTKSFVR
jgi:hypothetical protein